MNIEEILPQVTKPSRYVGNEFNIIKKNWDSVSLRLVLAFPDLYEIGMSHQGLQILYHIINAEESLLAERVYAPAKDMEKMLQEKEQPLFSLESKRPLSDFDVIGFTLPYELCYTNILTILKMAGIPWKQKDRGEKYPLVIGGGPCAFHPEPVADFFDVIFLGDGEEAVLEIASVIDAAKKAGKPKSELLSDLAGITGVYIPSFFEPQYDAGGNFVGIKSLKPGYEKVRRSVLSDLNKIKIASPSLVPLTKIVHDRLGVEIARGCTRGCRFCQAGIIYRPVRERSPESILEIAKKGIRDCGFDELAMLSLSTGDYSCLENVLVDLMNNLSDRRVAVSMPSMRVGTLTPKVMEQIRRVRKTGFTLAPEAGTDRLRRVINKGITEEDLLATCKTASELGWKLIKLYFMFGLPTETEEDFAAIAGLAKKVRQECSGRIRVNVSAATFVPKPHTPFQWARQLNVEEGFARIKALKEQLRIKGLTLKWHDPRQSFLEGVLARGDRRLSEVIEQAWLAGARLDAWTDHFNLDIWLKAARSCGIDIDAVLEAKPFDAPLPWHHLDVGVEADFFLRQYEKGLAEEYTPDCRNQGCQKCGLCDFKKLRPVTFDEKKVEANQKNPAISSQTRSTPGQSDLHFYYKLRYSRLGKARFLGHLELIKVFYRALRRAELPLNFSKGFNPSPKVTFSPALPLGTESHDEYLVLDLYRPINDSAETVALLNRNLPAGLKIEGVEPGSKKQPQGFESCYRIAMEHDMNEDMIREFLARQNSHITVIRKGKAQKVDVRPLVRDMNLSEDGRIQMIIISKAGIVGAKPLDILNVFGEISDAQRNTARVLKVWTQPLELR